MRETGKQRIDYLRRTMFVLSQIPTWLVLPAAEIAVSDLVGVASACGARSTHRGTWCFTSQRSCTSSLLGYDNLFSAKCGLGDFYQKTDDIYIKHTAFQQEIYILI
jgi:hypothetical protein